MREGNLTKKEKVDYWLRKKKAKKKKTLKIENNKKIVSKMEEKFFVYKFKRSLK